MSKTVDISDIPSAYALEDILCENFNRNEVPYTELCAHPETAKVIDDLLNPIRQAAAQDIGEHESLTLQHLKFRWGSCTIVRDASFPIGAILFR